GITPRSRKRHHANHEFQDETHAPDVFAQAQVASWCRRRRGRRARARGAGPDPGRRAASDLQRVKRGEVLWRPGLPALPHPAEYVYLTEYTTWRLDDKHSLAYAVLESPRGERMGELLGNDKKFVLKPEAGCLGCHSMHFPGREGDQFSPKDGVSCDGCHGPSE